MSFLKKRGEFKGENGRILVIGGSEEYIGAPAFAAMAALRSGTDSVVVAAPEKTAWSISSIYPDLITKKFSGDFFTFDNVKELIELSEKFDVIIIGNGLGLEPSTMDLIKELVERIPQPKVLDADALKALEGAEFRNAVLTPHKKEFEILTSEKLKDSLEKNAEIVKRFAREDIIITLKGKIDIISNKKEVKFNKTGNNAMSIGGTGDVLAGITASLIAQSNDLFNSAYNAAFLNGKIGDYLLKKKGVGFTASDMIDLIPEIKKKFLK